MAVFEDKFKMPPYVENYLRGLLQQQRSQPAPRIQQQPGYQTGLNYLQSIFEPDSQALQSFEEPAMRQFQQQIVPSIAERFALGDEKGSSGFQNTLAQAGSNLAALLNQQREQMRMQSLPQLLGYSQAPFEQFLGVGNQILGYPTQYQPSIWNSLAQGVGRLGTQAAINYFGS